MDLQRKQFKMDFHGRPLSLEVSRLAEQATASVLGRYGDTAVLVTVVMSDKEKSVDYFPLVVDYEERFYAAGKILGSRFIRREGRPSEEAILSGRLIDRTIRPLFDQRLRREVQLVVTILEIDEENDPDFITLLTASAALGISEIPWDGPVAGVKIFYDGQEAIFNPLNSGIKKRWPAEKAFVSFVAGTTDRINMIELEGIDAEEADIARIYADAQKEIAHLADWQKKIIKEIGASKAAIHLAEPDQTLVTAVKSFLHKDQRLTKAMYAKDKQEREMKISELKELLKGHLLAEEHDEKEIAAADHIFENEIDELVHRKILESNERPDGRKLDEVRELHAEVGLFKRTHGSALFIRGNTQALVVTTIAPPGSEQLVETMEFSGKRRFMLHYNFPPYSVGEVGRIGFTGRREIGHGALAEKAVRNLIPPQEEFPYTIRVVSEIISSNGSSSMATACGASLSLMDAGVPIKKAVAGIAMGMMVNQEPGAGNREPVYKILTDIQGPEDHHGDMDLKAAGTEDGVRAIQMDVKIDGLTNQMLVEALAQAKKARLEILKSMNKAISASRKELSPYAPMVLTLDINPSQIGDVIGPGGKIINGIIARTGALTIDIEQTGKVFIAGASRQIAEAAYKEVAAIVKEYQVGDVVEGTVVRILDFGAIVEFGPGRDGMVHVSELKEGYVKKVEDVVKLGDFVKARIVRIENGKIGLSIKALAGK
ncbi:MAG: polyribonucleotide nucleotidyltransferase [Candidatus Harrisonbacteria bacterium RIFCSPHIGHO2_01_FULL_44_13]|uniref:Polyribonucleotide nucleotidyltransferase n=1 Tax=Candidatus Harrisonbacteria bacterium RIFCSPLOWO2_01_FULL_44_18 TaxID=1798407 RepID=A0A1G1ZMW8_9BACT|nr:MAG: polyribonucleotide nucleotidyltransferase [Candidatus Harrisonbacteria bacterium RIFCSPHIGHO2_01_FULL_44_13]OGY65476.1 MAG: polyribonucleotide nucleotidyltransferase [Candidatus Harrisonbacteria bacterium RIFCSPLOWO2_01_FULL_44_18]